MADEPLFEVRNLTRQTVVATRVRWAGTSESRRLGLLGRDRLLPDEGLYLVPCQWIHMFGMRFPIDAAFLSRSGRILAVHENLRPWRLSRPVLRAEGVLELRAGTLRTTGTSVGDVLELARA